MRPFPGSSRGRPGPSFRTLDFGLWTLEELFRSNGVICRTQRVIQGDDNGHVGRPCEVSPAPPCPDLGSPQRRCLSLCSIAEIDPTLEDARRRSTASTRSEAEPRTRTTARPLVDAARCSRPSRSPPPPDRRPLPLVDVRMVGKTRQAGERPRRRGRARRIRANGTISGPAVGHRD